MNGTPPGIAPEHPSRSLFWSLLESGGLSLLSLAVLLVVARIAGPVELGAFAVALGIVQLLTLVVEMLVHDAIIQRHRLAEAHLHTAFWTCVSLAVTFSAVCWFGAAAIARVFHNDSVAPFLAITALSLLASAAGCVPMAVLRREMRFKPLALRSLSGRLGGAIVAIAMAAAGYGVWALVAQHLVQTFLNAALVWPATTWRPAVTFSPARLRELLSFGAYSVGTRIIWLSGGRILVLLVGNFLGVAAVGYLNIAQRVVDTLFDLLAGAAHNLALPILSRRQLDRPAFMRAYLQATEFTALVTQPMFGGLALCAPAIVAVLLGETWLAAAPVVQVLAIGAMLQFLLLFGPAAATAIGRPALVFVLSGLTLAAVTAALALARPDDVAQAAAIWVSRILFGGTLMHVLLSRLLGVSPMLLVKAIWLPVGATAAMAISLLLVQDHWLANASPLMTLLAIVPAGIVIYGALLAIAGRRSVARLLQFVWAARREAPQG